MHGLYEGTFEMLFEAGIRVNRWKEEASQAIPAISRVAGLVGGFLPVIEGNAQQPKNPCYRKSWEYLRYHGIMTVNQAEIFKSSAAGDKEGAVALAKAQLDWLSLVELSIQPVFDLAAFSVNMTTKEL